MSRKSRQDAAMERMRAANPVDDARLAATIGDEDLEREMLRSIASAEAPRQPVPVGDRVASEFAGAGSAARRPFSRRRGLRLGLGAGLGCVAILAAAILALTGLGGGGSQPAFAAAAVAVAEANPRLLVTEPGWKVTRADQFESGQGEITFSDGGHDVSLNWYPARYYRSYLHDRAQVSPPVSSTLLGRTATTVDYGGGDYATMLSPEEGLWVELRGQLADKQEYDAVLSSLRAVDIDTWLGAMPASVVRPEARADAVDQILQGVPLPPGLDLASLKDEAAVSSHYQLGAKVTGEVTCGWLESWLAATKAGDEATAQAAVTAMATSHDWPVLQQMKGEGAWSSVVWEFAADIAAGHLDTGVAGSEIYPDGRKFDFGPAYATALGCSGQYRREVDR